MKKSIITMFITYLLSTSVHAAIIDDGIYFKDDFTGYTWMDLTNFDLMTYRQVENEIKETNFKIATLSQLQQLWASAGNDFGYLYGVMGGVTYGTPGDLSSIIGGLFDSERQDDKVNLAWSTSRMIWTLETNNRPYEDSNYGLFKDTDLRYVGVWVVDASSANIIPQITTVPEPTTILFFGAGLVVLAYFARKHQFLSKNKPIYKQRQK